MITVYIDRAAAAAVFSDEDDEDDKHALLYLPITPEIEDVEESHTAEQQVLLLTVV